MASSRTEVSIDMRAVLVDWLVDVQQSFELNHESLYSAVKMFDLYLSRTRVSKSKIQLVGAVALNISCKYDVRLTSFGSFVRRVHIRSLRFDQNYRKEYRRSWTTLFTSAMMRTTGTSS